MLNASGGDTSARFSSMIVTVKRRTRERDEFNRTRSPFRVDAKKSEGLPSLGRYQRRANHRDRYFAMKSDRTHANRAVETKQIDNRLDKLIDQRSIDIKLIIRRFNGDTIGSPSRRSDRSIVKLTAYDVEGRAFRVRDHVERGAAGFLLETGDQHPRLSYHVPQVFLE